MRKGIDGLAMLAQQVLAEDPFGGALFAFRGKRGGLVKLLWYDGQGMCLFSKFLVSRSIPFPLAKSFWRGGVLERSSPVDEAVPSATLFDRRVCNRGSVQVTIAIARVLSPSSRIRPAPGLFSAGRTPVGI